MDERKRMKIRKCDWTDERETAHWLADWRPPNPSKRKMPVELARQKIRDVHTDKFEYGKWVYGGFEKND